MYTRTMAGAVLCLLAMAFLHTSPAHAGCKGNRVLVDGKCVEPHAIKCRTDSDCPGDQICKAERCVDPSAGADAAAVRFGRDKVSDARRRLAVSRTFSYIGLGFAAGGVVGTFVTVGIQSPWTGKFFVAPIGIGSAWIFWTAIAVPATFDGFDRLDQGLSRLGKQPHRIRERGGLLAMYFAGMALQAGGYVFLFPASSALDGLHSSDARQAAAERESVGFGVLGGSLMLAGTTVAFIALLLEHDLMVKGIAKLDRVCDEAAGQALAPRRVTPTMTLAPALLSDDKKITGGGLSLTGRW
jgi:MFS family permease